MRIVGDSGVAPISPTDPLQTDHFLFYNGVEAAGIDPALYGDDDGDYGGGTGGGTGGGGVVIPPPGGGGPGGPVGPGGGGGGGGDPEDFIFAPVAYNLNPVNSALPFSSHAPIAVEALNTPQAITYSFENADGTNAYSTAQQAAAITAMATWAENANINIRGATQGEAATIRFANSIDVTFASFVANADGEGGTILTNPNFTTTLAPQAGDYGSHPIARSRPRSWP